MREDESNWFSKWEDELPTPDELMPLTQTLISTDLALAFNIQSPQTHLRRPSPPPPPPAAVPMTPNSAEFDSSDFAAGGSAAGDEPARTLKRPRLVWTPQLHKRFVDAVAHLGIKNAVPKTIMQLMSVDGLTRENVASHLQKYRLYLKRMQGIGGSGGGVGSGDSATDHLFASSPVPPHFLHPAAGRPAADHFMPFVQVAAIQQQSRHHLAMGAGNSSSQFPAQYGQISHFGQVEHPFLARQQQQQIGHRLGGNATFMEDVDSGTHANGRKVLTLFPTGED